MNDWEKLFNSRLIMRERYFQTNNPDTVKKNLLQELLSNIKNCPMEDMKELVDFAYHPSGIDTSASYGNNPFFRALLAISDQIYIYDEFIQELGSSIRQNINLVLPPSKRSKTFKHKSIEIDQMHNELIDTQKKLEKQGAFKNIVTNLKRMEMLETSPNKALLFNLVDGKKTQTELWESFNQTKKMQEDYKEVSKQYIFQILREMEEDDLIEIKRIGKSKIAIRKE